MNMVYKLFFPAKNKCGVSKCPACKYAIVIYIIYIIYIHLKFMRFHFSKLNHKVWSLIHFYFYYFCFIVFIKWHNAENRFSGESGCFFFFGKSNIIIKSHRFKEEIFYQEIKKRKCFAPGAQTLNLTLVIEMCLVI